MLELWGMQSTLSLPSLPNPNTPGMVTTYRMLSMGQIELNCVHREGTVFAFKLRIYAKMNCLK